MFSEQLEQGPRLPAADVAAVKDALAKSKASIPRAREILVDQGRTDLAALMRGGDLQIDETRATLYRLRDLGVVDQAGMKDLARLMEPEMRGKVMDKFLVKNAGTSPLGIERGGSSPIKGRGIYSDEDLQTKTLEQYYKLKRAVEKDHFTVVDLGGDHYKILELDTIVWKPNQRAYGDVVLHLMKNPEVNYRIPPGVDIKIEGRSRIAILDELKARGLPVEVEMPDLDGKLTFQRALPPPKPGGPGAIDEQAVWRANDPEFALFAAPGARVRPTDILESMLENTTKGQHGILENLPASMADRETALLAGSKDVWRAMQVVGMCKGKLARLCADLDRVRSMDQALADLVFQDGKPAASMEDFRLRLRGLMKEAFEKGMATDEAQVEALALRMKSMSASAREAAAARIDEFVNQRMRLSARFQELARRNEKAMLEFLGRDAEGRQITPLDFTRKQMAAARRVKGSGPSEPLLGGVKGLVVALSVGAFVECLQRRSSDAPSATYVEVAGECIGEQAVMLGVGYLIGGAVNAVTFVLPPLGFAASVNLGLLGIGVSFKQVWDLTTEAVLLLRAYLEEHGANDALALQQRKNAMRFVERLGAEERSAKAAATDLRERRRLILSDLDALRSRQRQIQQSAGSIAALQSAATSLTGALTREDHCNVPSLSMEAARNAVTRVRALLDAATSVLNTCATSADLQQADAALARAQAVARDMAPGPAGAAPDQKPQRDFAREIREFIRRANLHAELAQRIEDWRTRVDQYKVDRRALASRLEAFRDAFPKDLLELNEELLEPVETIVAQAPDLDDESWQSGYQSLLADAGDIDWLTGYLESSQFQNLHTDLVSFEECLDLRRDEADEIRKMSDETARQVRLFAAAVYPAARAKCVTALAAPAKPAAPSKPAPKPTTPERPLGRPAYIFLIGPPERKDPVYFLRTGIPPLDGDGAYLFGDGTGGVYHQRAEYTGPFSDRDSLCAAMRGIGKTLLLYGNGPDYVDCDKNGPSTPWTAGANRPPSPPASSSPYAGEWQARMTRTGARSSAWDFMPDNSAISFTITQNGKGHEFRSSDGEVAKETNSRGATPAPARWFAATTKTPDGKSFETVIAVWPSGSGLEGTMRVVMPDGKDSLQYTIVAARKPTKVEAPQQIRRAPAA